ncbi:MAG: hypothetical protein IJK74_01760 [Bacteroidales bacterium]|nr:hypothetical protein [Bacteroidales bacterium]
MKIWKYLAVCSTIIIAALTSCSKVEPKDVVFEEKDKTILLYFASHNNLYMDAAANINKIIGGYVPDNGNIVLYCNNFDLTSRQMKDTLTLLVNIFKDKDGVVKTDTIYRFSYMNSCTKNAMKSVINITKTMCPAKEYGLVLWSHGTGWLPEGYYKQYAYASATSAQMSSNERSMFPTRPGGIDPYAHMVKSFGSELGVEMSVFDIKEAIGDTHFDFIAMDACFMGGIEIAYQLRDCCDYFIGSPAEILTDSFPYDKVIESMFKADYTGVSKNVYDYYNAQTGDYQSVTIATVKCSELGEVASQARLLFDQYRDGIPSLDVTAVQRYFRYDDHWFYDLNDFLVNLCGASATANFTAALEKAVIAKYTTGKMINLEINPAKFSGLSCYINNPEEATLITYYRKYDWNTDAGMILPVTSE